MGSTHLVVRACAWGAAFASTLLTTALVRAADPDHSLYLRLETGRHTAPVRTLSIAQSGLFATGSDDKTVRLWDPSNDKAAVRTVRMPLAAGKEGMVRSIALSPDGRYLLATGETGPTWNGPGSYSINLIDLDADGRAVARVPRLPAIVNVMAFDASGSSFYIGLGGAKGLGRLSKAGRIIGHDSNYRAAITAIDVGSDSRVVAVATDGTVRVYDAALNGLLAVTLRAKPTSVAFSPDARWIAVGTEDAGVSVLSAQDLSSARRLQPPAGLTGELAAVTWAQIKSETHLLASGTVRRSDREVFILGWKGQAPAPTFEVPVSRDRITGLRGLPQGGAVFVGAAPVVGRLNADGQIAMSHDGDQIDFRDVFAGQFGISNDGLTVAFGTTFGGNNPFRFQFGETGGALEKADEPAQGPSTLARPRFEKTTVPVKNWWNNRPLLGRTPLAIPEGEVARSLSVLADDSAFLLGTDNTLRLFDRKGGLIKSVHVPATVWGVMVAPRAPLAVAALGDGTLRWYSLGPDRLLTELAALFVHPDGQRWIAWTPEGVFAQSQYGGNDLVGYAKAQGEKSQPEWISFAQLFRLFYNPKLVYQNITDPDRAAPQLAAIAHLATPAKIEPPQVTLLDLCYNRPVSRTRDVRRTPIAPSATPAADAAEAASEPSDAEICQPFQEARTRSVRREPPPPAAQEGAGPSAAPPAPAPSALGQITLPEGVTSVRVRIRSVMAEGQVARELDVLVNGRNVGRTATRSVQRTPPVAPPTPPAAAPPEQPAQPVPAVANADGGSANVYEATRAIMLDPGENTIQVRAYATSQLYGTTEARLFAPTPVSPTRSGGLPTLYVIAVGVDEYRDPMIVDLKYAAADARSFKDRIASSSVGLYERVVTVERYNHNATIAGMASAFAEIAGQAGTEDAVLVYLAGHGDSREIDGKDTYLFLPHEGLADDLVRSAVTADMLVKYIAEIRARKLMLLLDTCFAGAFDTAFDPGAAISEESGRILVSAASSVETAVDGIPGANHGAFAVVALDGLDGKAAWRDAKSVDAGVLTQYLVENVPKIARSRAGHTQHVTAHQRSNIPFPVVNITQ